MLNGGSLFILWNIFLLYYSHKGINLQIYNFLLTIGVYYLFEGKPELAGIFLGTSINDTAQVSAAGYIYSQIDMKDTGLNASITTKLLRNSFLFVK